MPAVTRPPSFFPARLSQYVPNMKFAAEVINNGPCEVSFGTPALAAAGAVVAAFVANTAGETKTSLIATIDATYGRIVAITSTNVAITGYLFTISGRDFWGQQMKETIQPVQNTQVLGLKAFKYIDAISYALGTGAVTFSVDTGALLGLPYKVDHCLGEIASGVLAAAGTVTGPVLTDPQTLTTGDPRGKYTSTTAMDGVKEIRATFLFNEWSNASNNGGFMGIRHVAA